MMLNNYFSENIRVLDGGLASELERNGFSFLQDPLWSARNLHASPASIIEVHKNFYSYLEHGADIITTASYQASVPGFQKHLGITEDKSKELIKLSVELAKKAIKDYSVTSKRKILIAGSVGPYGAALADGSEYDGNYIDKISHEELMEWHRPRIECLVNAGVDLLAIETIPAAGEAEALVKLLRDFPNTKAWISFSSQSMHKTSHGEEISNAAKSCLKNDSGNHIVAIGVNCCPPDYAESLLKAIASTCPGFPLIVYPNSGENWCSKTGWTGKKTMSRESYLKNWINASAKIIGGCCRTTPEDIEKIFKFVNSIKDK